VPFSKLKQSNYGQVPASVYVLITAGGNGSRMGSNQPKQFLELLGRPMLYYSIKAFVDAFQKVCLVLVLPEAYLEQGANIVKALGQEKNTKIVRGGETRFHSVAAGLAEVPNGQIVLVHDGARPLVTNDVIRRVYEGVRLNGTAVPVIPVADSMRQISGFNSRAISRDDLRIVQTPQGFNSTELKKAYQQPFNANFTDEASVLEWQGTPVELVMGERCNFKITLPEDLAIAKIMLKQRQSKNSE